MIVRDANALRQYESDYPLQLFEALSRVSKELAKGIFFVGGTVRDWILRSAPNDIDLTVDSDARQCCRLLICVLGGGTYVPLGTSAEDAGRVVWRGLTIDFSGFREGAITIEEDLALRDFSLNAMGLSFSDFIDTSTQLQLIDPLHGLRDLEQGVLRACPNAFVSDPLRMLRGYRLWARFGFLMDEECQADIRKYKLLLGSVSAERITYEMDLIMASERAYEVVSAMGESGLLFQVIPGLQDGVGLAQPSSHHLDVYGHSLAALGNMEKILANPQLFFPGCQDLLHDYLAKPEQHKVLKWAALLHDLGKPTTHKIRSEKGDRITFYNHDEVGRRLVKELGEVLRWSSKKSDRVATLTGMHMHPFHFCNVRRKQTLSKKACLKLARRAGEDIIGLFCIAMADSLAGKGMTKPDEMEQELRDLLCDVLQIYKEDIQPALTGPRLLTGKDLIDIFSLPPGPVFSQILNELQEAQVEGEVKDRKEALEWVQERLGAHG